MRSTVLLLLGLTISISLQAQNLLVKDYCNGKFRNIEIGLSGLQRHCFSGSGDTLAVIDNDSLYLFDFSLDREISSTKLPFKLDSDAELGGIVDFYRDKIVVLQIFPTKYSSEIKVVVFNRKPEPIDSFTVDCNEWIFVTGFIGKIKLDDKNLILEDYENNKETLFINRETSQFQYVSYNWNSIYHVKTGFGESDKISLADIRKAAEGKLAVKNAIDFGGYIIAFGTEKGNNNLCRAVLVDKTKFKVFADTLSCYDCGAVRLFDSGFSWFKDGHFYRVLVPQDKSGCKKAN